MLVALAATAGGIDALCFLGLGEVFTANMTGNTVLLALAAAKADQMRLARSAVAFGGFVLGVMVGIRVARRGSTLPARERIWSPRVTAALGLEFATIAAFALMWVRADGHPQPTTQYEMIVLCAVAMGVQSAAVLSLHVPSTATTYLTGTLSALLADLTLRPRRRRQGKTRRFGIVAAVFAGALATASLMLHARSLAPLLPTLVLAAVLAIAFVRFRVERYQGALGG